MLIKSLPTVAILGRTNVGKSTLFNRLIEESKAVVSPLPGTTRDVLCGRPIWRGKTFAIMDTAGLDIEGRDELERNVLRQVKRAKAEAEILLLVLDGRAGILPEDRLLLKEILKSRKPFIVVANKIDNPNAIKILHSAEWSNLPVKKILPVSAKNGMATGDLLDEIFEEFKKQKINLPEPAEEPSIKAAILGKPNVGKSSLLNALLGKEVAVTSALPHTTREPQDITLEYNGRLITLIDTAGIRKKARVIPGLERVGVKKSLETMRQADIVLLVLDASEPLGVQDKNLLRLAEEAKRSIIFIANKMDLAKEAKWREIFSYEISRHFPYLDFAPTVFVSAMTKKGIADIFDAIFAVDEARKKEADARELNDFIKTLVRRFKPTKYRGVRHPYIFGMKQTGVKPPRFVITIKEKTSVHPSYIKFLEKRLRERFDFIGTPIIIETRHIRI